MHTASLLRSLCISRAFLPPTAIHPSHFASPPHPLRSLVNSRTYNNAKRSHTTVARLSHFFHWPHPERDVELLKKPDSSPTVMAPQSEPPLEVRWAHTGSQYLDLPVAPVVKVETAYKAFSPDESDRIEAAWKDLPSGKRADIIAHWGREDGEGTNKKNRPVHPKKGLKKKPVTVKLPEKPGEVISDDECEEPSDCEQTVEELDELYKGILERAQNDPARLDVVEGVAVSQDSLFEVDLNTLSLHPVFWPQSGARLPVIRGTWFVGDETKPCGWDLAEELEKAFQQIKPWESSYREDYTAAMVLGAAGEEKLKFSLPERFGPGLAVIFEDESKCRVMGAGALDYLSRALRTSLGTKNGTLLYRGYSSALASRDPQAAGKVSRSASSTALGPKSVETTSTDAASAKKASQNDDKPVERTAVKVAADKKLETAQEGEEGEDGESAEAVDALEETHVPVVPSHINERPCTDLILVIHGIGQHLAAEYEAFNIVYASNQLRQMMRKQAVDPALADVIKDGRAQVLPVQWRANLKLDSGDVENENDNIFSVADITIDNSIPYVRQITNSVLLDIPLFMSHHRQKMIEAVCSQANKLYRLWIARNPGFEENGRVHVIGHSLGSALAAHILSNQPTLIPPLSTFPKQAIEETTDRFLFNTHNLFLAGSPLGIFLQLDQSHLVARAGRGRTMDSPPGVALQRAGEFGCMAVDSLYNVFYFTDPVAYSLNATIDVQVAKTRPPLAIRNVAGSVFPALPAMPAMPAMPVLPNLPPIPDIAQYLPSYLGGAPASAASPEQGKAEEKEKEKEKEKEEADAATEELDPSGGYREAGDSLGERRFAALNPHGGVDFSLPALGVNGYLDMITAHGNYWNDPNFAAFVLSETYGPEVNTPKVEKADG